MILFYKIFSDWYSQIINRILPISFEDDNDQEALDAAMAWLLQAVKNGNGGVASKYNLIFNSWTYPFPETTGYIIPTLWDYYNLNKQDQYKKIAINLTNWLGVVMLPNGACIGGVYKGREYTYKPIVFNTGQNIFGYVRSFLETENEEYLEFAKKSADFLVNSVDDSLIWTKNVHNDIPHTYNSRVSWALLELNKIVKNELYENVARANIEWTLNQQLSNGYFRNCNFKKNELPNLHGISYTLRGLIESYYILKEEKLLLAVELTAKRLQRKYELTKNLYTFWDENWRNHDKYSSILSHKYICLTSYAQLGMVFLILGEVKNDLSYINTGFKLIDTLKKFQNIKTKNKGIYGGIAGSFPIYGRYSFLQYPNWAAKFFADAIIMKMRLKKKLNEENL